MKRPNILYIITDQHRADHVGCYGNPVVQTPAIDGLAARGVRFDRFYVTTPVCMPNRAVLMTGRMPTVNGVRMNGIPLSLRASTFVDTLRAGGYRTALVGKAHLQNMEEIPPALRREPAQPNLERVGNAEATCDETTGPAYRQELPTSWEDPDHRLTLPFYGFEHVDLCDSHGDLAFGDYKRWLLERAPEAMNWRGPENAIPDSRYICPQAYRTRVPEELYPTSYIADRTSAFLEAHAKDDSEAPFFLMCSFNDPHHPFTPPGKYWDMYDPDSIELPASFSNDPASAPPHVRWLHEERLEGRANVLGTRAIAVDEREAREATALTYGMITMIDDAVAKILRKLSELGLDENTVVIFNSDHGDLMGDHGLIFKHPLHYQSLIRVPFIWAEPGERTGSTTQQLAGTVDIAKTILTRCGFDGYNGLQGQNLFAKETVDRPVLIEDDIQRAFGGFERPLRCRTLVTQDWRMTMMFGSQWGELYNLTEDPSEVHNLWFEEKYRAVKADLIEQLAVSMMEAADDSPLPTRIA